MYVVIVCLHCNGTSQVEEDSLGKVVQCPLCGRQTVARTAQAVLPVAKPVEATTAAAPPATLEPPLSLDDAPSLPPKSDPVRLRPEKSVDAPAKRSPVRTALYAGTSLLLTLLLMGAIYIYATYRRGSDDISAGAWRSFKPPEGKCSIDLPGEPEVEEIPPGGSGNLGGKRFVVKFRLERMQVSFGWIDLDADKWLAYHFDQVVGPVRDAEVKWLHGKVVAEATVTFVMGKRKLDARLYQLDTEEGKGALQVYFDSDPSRLSFHEKEEALTQSLPVYTPVGLVPAGIWLPIEVTTTVKRRVVEPGQRLRLYFASVNGKKVTANTRWLSRFFNSFVPE